MNPNAQDGWNDFVFPGFWIQRGVRVTRSRRDGRDDGTVLPSAMPSPPGMVPLYKPKGYCPVLADSGFVKQLKETLRHSSRIDHWQEVAALYA